MGGWMYHWYANDIFAVFKNFAIIVSLSFFFSLFLSNLPVRNAKAKFNFNPLHEVIEGSRYIKKNHVLLLCTIGSIFLCFSSGLLFLVLPKFGIEILGLHQGQTSFLNMFMCSGIIVGTLFAGHWSNNKMR